MTKMSEVVSDKASDVLLNMVNITIQTMSDVVEFSKQQIPEVIHQLLMWKAVESFIAFALNFVFIVVAILMMTRWGKRVGDKMARRREQAAKDFEEGAAWTRYARGSSQTSTSYDFLMGGSTLLRWGVVALGAVIFFGALENLSLCLDWLKILIAPKVYLIEYAASLVKAV